MHEYVFLGGVFSAALIAGLLAWGGLVGGLQWAQRFPNGLLPYYFYAIFASNALAVFLSGRSYDESNTGLFDQALTSNSIAGWSVRLTSLLTMLAAVDQIVRFVNNRPSLTDRRLWLGLVFIAFWLSNLMLPAYLATHTVTPSLSWFYSLFLGVGLVLMGPETAKHAVYACRNAVVMFCLISLLTAIVRPDIALQINYTEGYLPGVPRLSGLSPHAGGLGATAGLAIWSLITYPMMNKWLNRFCLLLVTVTLFFCQTKTVWFILFLSIPVLVLARKGKFSFNKASAKGSAWGGAALLLSVLMMFAVVGMVLIFADLDRIWSQFMLTEQGARLSSMTGRDRIWAICLAEWERSPLFGYGLPLLGTEHRFQMGMWWATNGHNQFIDALGRAGLLGATGAVVYIGLLLWLGLRYLRASRGFSAVLALSIVLRTVSDVPITLQSINTDSTAHYLLLAVLAMYINTGARIAKSDRCHRGHDKISLDAVRTV